MVYKRKKFVFCLATIVCVFLLVSVRGYNQDAETDSLLQVVAKGKDDSLKVNALISLAISNAQSSPDKALAYANQAKDLSVKTGFKTGEGYAYKWLGIINNNKGNYYEALVNSNKSLNIFEMLNDKKGTSNLLNNLGAFYADKGEDSKAVEYYLKSLDLARQSGNKQRIESALTNIGVTYFKNPATNDKALEYYLEALPYALEIKDDESTGIIYTNIGEVYTVKNEFDSARYYYYEALKILDNSAGAAYTYNDLGKLYKKKDVYDSAEIYFDKAYLIATTNNAPVDETQSLTGKAQLRLNTGETRQAVTLFNNALQIATSLELIPELKEIYKDLSVAYVNLHDYKNAFSCQSALNKLYNAENEQKLSFNTATLAYTLELQKQSAEVAVLKKENELQGLDLAKEKMAKNTSIAGFAVLLVFAFFLLINIRQRKKLNHLLSSQKEEIAAQKISVEETLIELKATQSHLIQSEKMASLGELTSGIAHEIQNPLNFVNNFSEMNAELIGDMKEEIKLGNYDEAMQIAGDIEENEQKINRHGKRAEAIVKGMLQHSRKNTGQKEFTDINALANEYLRLSYHGVKAKEKPAPGHTEFHAEIKTAFDTSLGKIKIIPQDIGMVLLNLFNNAFYAIHEKQKANTAPGNGQYIPAVNVATIKLDNKIQIKVADNGTGIPQKVIDKIFQPFFTTKPTGEGTGLGLSLSYEIIKAHGGEIRVETKAGEGSEFIIQLPG